ncbi:MAG: RNA polymerase factor sigma-54 [Bacillota bacterium]
MHGQYLNLEQRQKLVLSPQLRQALTVLQLPLAGLAQMVQQELCENPVLEVQEEPDWRAEDAQAEEPDWRAEDAQVEEPDWLEFFGDCSDLGVVPGEQSRPEPRGFDLLANAPSGLTGGLGDYLLFQLHVSGAPADLQVIGEYLVGCLDSRGYLAFSTDEVAGALGCDCRLAEEALALVQSLDPPGVGARSLQECLLLQLHRSVVAAEDGEVLALAECLVREHLEDLAAGRLDRLALHLCADVEKIRLAARVVRGLDPKPGLAFGGQPDVRYVQPDVVVERVGSDYVVLVSDWGMPRLGVSRYYRRLLLEGMADEPTRQFLQERMRRAVWFLRSIEQRRYTLHRVAETMFRYQRDFLDRGWPGLRPLTLRQVAEGAGCHESTVSRAVAGKYAQTPRGMFPLRFFFPGALAGRAGEAVANAAVKRLVQEMVSGEDPASPYSDEVLVALLRERGIDISRRTVAKYRAELGIASSARRRRYGR